MASKGYVWVSEQRLVDQANTIRRNSLDEEEVAIVMEIAEVIGV